VVNHFSFRLPSRQQLRNELDGKGPADYCLASQDFRIDNDALRQRHNRNRTINWHVGPMSDFSISREIPSPENLVHKNLKEFFAQQNKSLNHTITHFRAPQILTPV